jgi:hypothetical protein
VCDFRCTDHRLQIIIGLCLGTACLEHIRQSRQPQCKPGFRRLSHGLRILQVGFRRILLSLGIEHLIVRGHDLVDHLAMRVVEKEVRRQQIVAAHGDLVQPAAEIEDGVVQLECR